MIPTPRQKQLPPEIQRRAVAYGRYSYAGQRDVSIEQQLKDIHAFAKREGYTIVHEYADHAKSGYRHIEARKAFNAMMEDAKRGAFGTIIVWKVDRFGRNREESAIFKGRLRQYGVRVIYAMEPIPDGSAGVLLEGMLEATAEWYSRTLAENVTRGLNDNASRCMYNGTRYLGYRRGPDGRFAINPEEAPIVREIYQLYLSGSTTEQICSILNQRGLKTTRGKDFGSTAIVRILRNERYSGVYIWGDYRQEGGVPAIVSRQQWEEVQAQLDKRQKRISANQVEYLLTGKLFCGHCGTAMVGDSGTSHTGTTHYYYSCMQRKNRRSCDKKSVRKELIETAVINYMLDQILDEATISRMADMILVEQKKSEQDSLLVSLKAEHTAVRRKIDNINNAIAQGVFSASTKTMLLQLEAEERELQETVATAEFTQAQLLTKERIVYWMQKFTEGDRNDEAVRARLINIFLNSVYLYDTDNGSRMKILLNAVGEEATVTFDEIAGFFAGSDRQASGVPDVSHPNLLRGGRVILFDVAL